MTGLCHLRVTSRDRRVRVLNSEQTSWAGQSAEELAANEGARYWRASKHEVQIDSQGLLWIEAARDTKWSLFSPLRHYSPSAPPREARRGPHTEFIRLKESILEMSNLETALEEAKRIVSFADKYGLLGRVYEWYSAPILPADKWYVLPDAAITTNGEWKELDNSSKDTRKTEGFKLLQKWVTPDYLLPPQVVARPSELKFAYKRNRPAKRPDPAGFEPSPELVDWATVQEPFGVVMLLDGTSGPGARMHSTRELADSWQFVLPSCSKPLAELSDLEKRNLALSLRAELSGVSPYPSLNERDEWERGWRCPSLLQAICLMLYYDLTGHVDIRKCALPSCGDYFRTTAESRSKYCPSEEPNKASKCASAATSRRYRARRAGRTAES